jgi:cytochrome c551/c552
VADSQAADSLVKREPEGPAPDPIVSRSTSGIVLVSVLLLTGSLVWALYDESYGQRPWKGIQREFVSRYTRYLKSIKANSGKSEEEIKSSPEYQALDEDAKAALEKVQPRIKEIDEQVPKIQAQLDAVTDPFQNQRGRLMVINYNMETAGSGSAKQKYAKQADAKKQERVAVEMPASDGAGKPAVQKLNYTELEKLFNDLRDQKATLLSEKADLLKTPGELAKKRDDYLKNQLIGLGPSQIQGLINAQDRFDYSILGHQINVPEFNVVDRCEVCHLGTRASIDLKPENMVPASGKPDALSRAFVSHPNRDLLQIHNADKFGCSGCHWGNGRATTSEFKAHGNNEHWLWPLFEKDNMQAGCQQCHAKDRITQGAETVNLGRDLFYVRGCVGCHRYEGFDRETDALNSSRQSISQLEDQIAANEKQRRQDTDASANAADDAEAKRLLAHAESLRVSSSLLAARIDQLNLQTKSLMEDQKKVGPNLKDVRLKLRAEWIPVWLKDPQAFRPGTKMPKFWRFSTDKNGDGEIKAISAYLWQSSFDGKIPQQQKGDVNHGKELFETRGCLACHSIGEGDNRNGGTFAANLTKVGEKANFDYIVRWIYNPRARYAPYCPKEKRDLTAEDYAKHGKTYLFDTELHSKCPNDGAELQVQNMTVMPDFRLAEQDARDIATYLFSLSSPPQYEDASFIKDPNLKEQGRLLIKQFGCAGCHEIKGFEDEQRIGKELTVEGATPIERLDFALLTKSAEEGIDPAKLHPEEKEKPWYNARGFFEHKLDNPSIYDQGKVKDEKDQLRMPQPYMNPEWRTALTTFLLGSVGAEGANVPKGLFFEPQDGRRQDIQNGWWVIKKYNCMGCHAIQPGQRMVVAKGDGEQYLEGSVLMNLSQYQTPEGKDFLPPRLTSEGARVDPNWLLRFLHDPSLGAAQTGNTAASQPVAGKPAAANADQSDGKLVEQPGLNRNGVRPYLQARMPTFNFSPNELQTLVRFFIALSGQQAPYIKEQLQPLTDQERQVARDIFTSGTPCLKCHITGEPVHDAKAIAPNFLLAGERLKPEWTFRWLLDPSQISPGTAMPSGLFTKHGERWTVSAPGVPKDVTDYEGDHADLLVRYMFLMTPDENKRLLATSPAPPAANAPAQTAGNAKTNKQTGWYRPKDKKSRSTVALNGTQRPNARAPNP